MLAYSHLTECSTTNELANFVELLESALNNWEIALLIDVFEVLALVESSLVYVYIGGIDVLGLRLVERQGVMDAVVRVCVLKL